MDTVKFLREFGRMCNEHISCKDCLFKGTGMCLYNGDYYGKISQEEAERAVRIVENWSRANPEEIGKKYIIEIDKVTVNDLCRIKGTTCLLDREELEQLEEYKESEE